MGVSAFIPLAFTGALTLCMIVVLVLDATRYIIPNNLNLVIVLLYGVGAFFLPVHPLMAVLAAAILLVVGLGLFALGLMGGGDIKLLAALGLWTGWGQPTIQFIVLTALIGGVLVIVMLILRSFMPQVLFHVRPTKPVPRFFTRKQPVPYGLAIAGSFLVILYTGGIPGLV